MAKKEKYTKEQEMVRDAAPDLLTAIKMLMSATDNRTAIMAVEIGKRAIMKAEGKPVD